MLDERQLGQFTFCITTSFDRECDGPYAQVSCHVGHGRLLAVAAYGCVG